TLMLDATGGTVNRTLHTYLMEGGETVRWQQI
ncbi:hypothetical protein SEES7308_16732, partial [Salmonella enterica subsp. enterica serovar Stanley str. ATCC 7308]